MTKWDYIVTGICVTVVAGLTLFAAYVTYVNPGMFVTYG